MTVEPSDRARDRPRYGVVVPVKPAGGRQVAARAARRRRTPRAGRRLRRRHGQRAAGAPRGRHVSSWSPTTSRWRGWLAGLGRRCDPRRRAPDDLNAALAAGGRRAAPPRPGPPSGRGLRRPSGAPRPRSSRPSLATVPPRPCRVRRRRRRGRDHAATRRPTSATFEPRFGLRSREAHLRRPAPSSWTRQRHRRWPRRRHPRRPRSGARAGCRQPHARSCSPRWRLDRLTCRHRHDRHDDGPATGPAPRQVRGSGLLGGGLLRRRLLGRATSWPGPSSRPRSSSPAPSSPSRLRRGRLRRLDFFAVVDFEAVDFAAVRLRRRLLGRRRLRRSTSWRRGLRRSTSWPVDFEAVDFLAGAFLAAVDFAPSTSRRRLLGRPSTVPSAAAFFAAPGSCPCRGRRGLGHVATPSAASAASCCPDTTAFRSAPAVNFGTAVFLALIRSPVRGLRTQRASRTRFSNEPKPVIATFSPRATSRVIVSRTDSRACWACLRLPS